MSTDETPGTGAGAPLPELGPGGGPTTPGSVEGLLDLMMPVTIEFGRTAMTLQDVMQLGRGSVIQLDRLAGEPIDIYVSDRKLAEGEVVVIGEHFGVRITRVIAPATAAST
jgi:flagellar motor switch protein FliN/FliY